MSDTNTAWVDLVSPSHPFFFKSLLDELPELNRNVTVRQKTETVGLADSAGFDYDILGRDFDNTFLRKVGIPLRTIQATLQAPDADISLSSRNAMCVLASKARGIPSIHFTDNDITAHVDGLHIEKLYNRFEAQATHNVVPAAFDTNELTRWGATSEQIHTYDGYKEDIYIANFEPDTTFQDQLPFNDYIVIRPEALGAAYVDTDQSIIPELLERATDEGLNVVYLPRGRDDEEYAEPFSSSGVYIPSETLDGLQLAWYSDGVLTGSGTMAREAACMGIPAVSFFPETPLSVDQEMINDGMIFHSRDSQAIVEFIDSQSTRDREADISRSEDVLSDVVATVNSIINSETNQKRTMKVLNLINARKPFLMDQINALEEAGIESDTICVPGDFNADGSEFTSRSILDYAKFYPKILSKISNKYDIIHAHYGLTAPFALAQPYRPVVLSLWGRDLFGPAAPLSKVCARFSDEVIVRSEEMREELSQPAHIVERGVDLEKFEPMDQKQARTKVNWSKDGKHILFPYSPQREKKNYPLAEEVVGKVNSMLDENVILHAIFNEPHEKIPIYMNAADLLLMTSRPKSEGSPNTVKEALACNTPVVSTDVGNVSDLIGYLPNYHVCYSTSQLVSKTIAVLNAETNGTGRERAKELSWSNTTDSLLSVYSLAKS